MQENRVSREDRKILIMGLSSVLVVEARACCALAGRWQTDPRSCGGYRFSVFFAATRAQSGLFVMNDFRP